VSEARVFDHTAVIALFDGNDQVFRLWQQANDDELTLVMPAVAVAEANNVIGATSNAWRPVLDASGVVVTPLDQSTAIDTATGIGSLIVRHVLHEAREIRGGIVTGAPWQYPAGVVPIWTI
jgi:hypothetical protein